MQFVIMIVLWLLSYFLSKKAGARSGTAALAATGVTAGAYYTGAVDWLANDATKLVSGGATSTTSTSTAGTAGNTASISTGSTGWGTVGSVANGALSATADVLKSWGPAGTAGVAATTSFLSGDIDKKWLWLGAGVTAFLLLRK